MSETDDSWWLFLLIFLIWIPLLGPMLDDFIWGV